MSVVNPGKENMESSPFTAAAVRKLSEKDKIAEEHRVELNELARQVAELFSADAISPRLVSALVRLGELVGLMACALLVYAAYLPVSMGNVIQYGSVSAAGAMIAVVFTQAFDGYQTSSMRKFIAQFSAAATGFTLAMILLVLIGFFTKSSIDFSRMWFGSWYLSGLLFILLYRAGLAFFFKQVVADGRLERRAVIVGGGNMAADLIRALEAQRDSDIRICGIFDDRDDDRSPAIVAGYPKLGTVAELVEFGRRARIDMLIVSLPLSAENRVLQMLNKLWILPVDIRLSAHTNKLRFRPRSYSYEGTVALLDVFDKPIADWDALAKRIFDIVISSLALVALSPLMIGTAVAVKLESKGPVLFRQKRYGFNNELLDVYKFRSMYMEMSDSNADKLVTRNDSRVTRVGRFIRKTSIDELPQLFNVLRGDLSLVGPRPHALNAKAANTLYHEAVDGYFARHKVKPGVTGWAQINGWRGETDTLEKLMQRVNHDLYYIENWSLMLDLYILAVTPFKILNTENAY